MKKAIAYMSEINLEYCQSSICCDEQLKRIESFCRENDIELVDVVKDSSQEPNLFNRPGIQYLLAKCQKVDFIIVERPWCLSRRSSVLDEFLSHIDNTRVKLVCATQLWDCASQYVRRYHYNHTTADKDTEVQQKAS
jgi:DNA invertase Pin-like site-specific DNA recombinase